MTTATQSQDEKPLKPFVSVAGIWLGVLAFFLAIASHSSGRVSVVGWGLGLAALCCLDLWALAKFGAAFFRTMTARAEKRAFAVIQASYWGMIKLVCLGTFGIILFRSQSALAIPASSLLLGMGTLIVVPLVGGFWWFYRESI